MQRVIVLILVGLLVLSSSAHALTGIISVNDERNIDYTLSTEEFEKIVNEVRTSSTPVELIKSGTVRDYTNLSKIKETVVDSNSPLISDDKFRQLTTPLSDRELSWLVDNNIVSRDTKITIGPDSVNADKPGILFDYNNERETMNRSEFLVGAYKSIYGVINSRPISVKANSWRVASQRYIVTVCEMVPTSGPNGETAMKQVCWEETRWHPERFQKISGGGETYKYFSDYLGKELIVSPTEGDHKVFVSPNVYELYLLELLNKKIINSESLSDLGVKEAYNQAASISSNGQRLYPRWHPDAGPFLASSNYGSAGSQYSFINGTSVLGKRLDVSGSENVNSGTSSGNVTITISTDPNDHIYFVHETIDTVEALKYVESMLRLTEKDMTDTETTIVTYKYGASYLSSLSEDDRKTVMFLTAKGILNFEDPTEYINLYGELTKEFAYKLMYRIANPNARLDFSKVQLTDSDNFWLSNGYSQLQLKLNFYNPVAGMSLEEIDEELEISPLPDVNTISVRERSLAYVEPEVRSFLGFKWVKGTSKLAETVVGNSTYEIIKVFDVAEKYKYKGIRLTDRTALLQLPEIVSISDGTSNVSVTFSVVSGNAVRALSAIDSNIQIGTDYLFETSSVNAVTKYDQDGKQLVLVPQSLLEEQNMISVLEDKVLRNNQTGATAVLLKNKKIALVGNHVIDAPEIMVESINGEVYYNLEVIRTLMTNTYISSIDPNSIYFSSTLQEENLVDVFSSTGNKMGSTYVIFKSIFTEGGDSETSGMPVTDAFANISHMATSSNFLIKTFEVVNDFKKVSRFRVLVEFVYRLPEQDMSFTNPIYKSSNPSFDEINSFIYERPEDPELRDWWDNNIEMSNALMNTFFKTTRETYVRSGYLVPNLSILYDDSDVIQQKYLTQFFQEVGTHFSKEFVGRFLGSRETYNQPAPKGTGAYYDPNNNGGVYYPEKGAVRDLFPLWVHAMFNNTGGSSELSGSAFDTFEEETKSKSRNNSTLWRNLMADRTLYYNTNMVPEGTINIYSGNGGAYIVTKGESVYRLVNPLDTKFPTILKFDGNEKEYKYGVPKNNSMSLHVTTRTERTSAEAWVGRYVRERENVLEFYVDSVVGNKIRLVDTSWVYGTPVESTKNGKTFFDVSGEIRHSNGAVTSGLPKAIESRYNQLYAVFARPSFSDYTNSISKFDDAVVIAETKMPVETTKPVYLGGSDQKADSLMYKWLGTKRSKDDLMGNSVWAPVVVELDMNYWRITDQGVLAPVRSFPFLQIGNIYFSGINQGLIDSMLLGNIGGLSVNEIPDNSRLYVGDIAFTKVGNRFVSDPQQDVSSWKSTIEDADSENAVKVGINRALNGMAVSVSGKSVRLGSFVREMGLHEPVTFNRDTTVLGSYSKLRTPYIHVYDSQGVVRTSQYDKNNNPTVDAVVFFITLSDDLYARKMDLLGNSYQLLMSTSKYSEGFTERVPFFNESLSLSEGEDLLLLGTKVNFRPLTKASELKEGFLRDFSEAKRGDLFSLVKVLLMSLVSFLIIMSWIIFAILRFGIFDPFLEFIRNPYPDSDRKGFDLVKLLSLGLFTMDSTLTVAKLIIGNLGLFIFLYILVGVVN